MSKYKNVHTSVDKVSIYPVIPQLRPVTRNLPAVQQTLALLACETTQDR